MTATKRQRCVILLAAFASTAVIVASAYSYSKIGFSGILPMIDDKVNPSDGTKYNSTNNETKQRGNIKSSAPRNETEVARETPENKRKEWLPVQHKNPSFPSDIYCAAPAVPVGDISARTPKKSFPKCWRHCAGGGQRNKIVYVFPHKAGLGDRISVFTHLVELAGYLCATLHVPRPALLLDDSHNSGVPLDDSLKWSDLVNFSFYTNIDSGNSTTTSTPLKDLTIDEIQAIKTTFESGKRKTIVTGANANGNPRLISTRTSTGIIRDFNVAKTISMHFGRPAEEGPNRFLWAIFSNWYDLRGTLIEYLKQTEDASPSPLYLPLARGHFPYTFRTQPTTFQEIADQLWDYITDKLLLASPPNNTWIGSWHIRRTDAKTVCDTSLKRLGSYIKCTFQGTQHLKKNVAVLIHSDEVSPAYWQGIRDHFATHARHVQVVFVDDLVKNLLQSLVNNSKSSSNNNNHTETKISKAYLNNYHVFMIVEAVAAKADAFRLRHRRAFDCRDCFNLTGNLLGRMNE